eukprot:CFRG2575T1
MTRSYKLFKYASRGSTKKVKKCLERGNRRITVNDQDIDGLTCLHHAARWGHADLVRMLLALNADPNIQTEDDKETPLHIAVVYRHPDVVNALLEFSGTRTDIPNANGTVCNTLLGNHTFGKVSREGNEHSSRKYFEKFRSTDRASDNCHTGTKYPEESHRHTWNNESEVDNARYEREYYAELERGFRDDDYVRERDQFGSKTDTQDYEKDENQWNEKLLAEMGFEGGDYTHMLYNELEADDLPGAGSMQDDTGEWMDAIAEDMKRKMREKISHPIGSTMHAGFSSRNNDEPGSERKQRPAKRVRYSRTDAESDKKEEEHRRHTESERIIREQMAETERKRHSCSAETRMDYEKRWAEFVAKLSVPPEPTIAESHMNTEQLLKYDDIPWPFVQESITDVVSSETGRRVCGPMRSIRMDEGKQLDMIKRVLLMGVDMGVDESSFKTRVRLEQRRWHPDKWPESTILRSDRKKILDKVKAIVQILNNAASQ